MCFEKSVCDTLTELESKFGKLNFENFLDQNDPIGFLRNEFIIPHVSGSSDEACVYFVGNSLGPQPRECASYISESLTSWADRGVTGHFSGERPWLNYDEFLVPEQARLVGALPLEIAIMNSLTVNLHLLLVRFYSPLKTGRWKILVEDKCFPSDLYAIASQVRLHGGDPDECIIKVSSKKGQETLNLDEIVNTIHENGKNLALVVFGGVQYYTGQYFDIPAVTRAAHAVGAFAVWDLGHAVGNVDLRLHDWEVDGACWCSYKYLNAGPGSVAGFFIHTKHFNVSKAPKLAGWWGHDVNSRFLMDGSFVGAPGANEFRLSNVPIFAAAALFSSLRIFEKASMQILRAKSLLLTGLLERTLGSSGPGWKIITPTNQRGAQLSLLFENDQRAKHLQKCLEDIKLIVDYRKPGLVRVTPAPLYCTFKDVALFCKHFLHALEKI